MLGSIEPAGVNDPGLIVAELEELVVYIRTAAAALAKAVINIRNHNLSSLDQCYYPVWSLRHGHQNRVHEFPDHCELFLRNSYFPTSRPLLMIFPAELSFPLVQKNVIKGLGVMIVRENQLIALFELIKSLENQRVPVLRDNCRNIHLYHSGPPRAAWRQNATVPFSNIAFLTAL
jgi:hypothetical protein